MTLHIVTAEERLAEANSKTTLAIFGPPGAGKTSLLWTLLASTALCVDLEAGMKSVEDWSGDSIPIRLWLDAVDIACLIGGVDPSADPSAFFSEGHYQHVAGTYPDLVQLIAQKRIIFVDSITELTRQCMAWAKTRPEAFSEKTGRPDTRAAFGLLARQVISMSLFEPDGDGWRHEPASGQVRRLVCRAGNRFALPAKDRSGQLDETE